MSINKCLKNGVGVSLRLPTEVPSFAKRLDQQSVRMMVRRWEHVPTKQSLSIKFPIRQLDNLTIKSSSYLQPRSKIKDLTLWFKDQRSKIQYQRSKIKDQRSSFGVILAGCLLFVVSCLLTVSPAHAATYYIAPDKCEAPYNVNCNTSGSDSNSGAQSQPWKNFTKAWQSLQPGDTLILLNGVFTQHVIPTIAGTASLPITIKALNDGQAVVDGEFKRQALSTDWRSPNHLHMIFEGMNFKNGGYSTVSIGTHYTTLRRFHAYNDFIVWNDLDPKPTLEPQHPVHVGGSINNPLTNVLLEDCITSGHGTKMLKVIRTSGVTVRRCITDWRWHGAHTDWNLWPWAGGLNVYHTGNNIFENIVSLGISNTYAINFHGLEANKDPNDPNHFDVSGNRYLGSIAMNSGYTNDGEVYSWSTYRPHPSGNSNPRYVHDYTWGGRRNGFGIGGNIKDTTFRDILAYGNAVVGYYREYESGEQFSSNTQILNSTFAGNHNRVTSGHPSDGPMGTNANLHRFRWSHLTYSDGKQGDMSVSNTYIQNNTNSNYQNCNPLNSTCGAEIRKRYVDGVKTSQDLWPWPMEQRVRDELGYSITNKIATMTQDLNSKGHLAYTIPALDSNPFPVIHVGTTFIQFDVTSTGSTNHKQVVVRNTGNANLIINRFRVIDDFQVNAFSITNYGGCSPTNQTLAPGQECNLTVRFSPTVRDDYHSGRIAVYPSNMGRANHPEIISLLGLTSGTNPTPTPTQPPPATPTPTRDPSLPTPTPTPTPGPIHQSLLAHWKFDEGSGSVATDTSGNGHTGTLVNNPQWVEGIYAGALNFNNSSSQSVVADSVVPYIQDRYLTMSAWVKPGDHSGSLESVMAIGSGSNSGSLAIERISNNTFRYDYRSGSANACSFNTTATTGEWFHLTVTFDGSDGRTYVNGELKSTCPTGGYTPIPSPAYFRIGARQHSSGTGSYWNGVIDDVRIYNRPLTQSEIHMVMNNQDPSTPHPADTNNDGVVNIFDLNHVIANFTSLTLSAYQTVLQFFGKSV